MNKLEEAIQAVSEQLKSQLSEASLPTRFCYLNQLQKTAELLGINEPCQELFDNFLVSRNDSKSKRFYSRNTIKLVDVYAGTHALKEDGSFFNDLQFPDEETALEQLEGITHPINTIDMRLLIIKAKVKLQQYNLSESTLGQYVHAWKNLLCFCFLKGSTMYKKEIVETYIYKVGADYKNGQLQKWEWKINRRCAHILIEIAETGRYVWEPISKEPCCDVEAFEDVRSQYLKSLKERNLSNWTVRNHDSIFRKALKHSKFSNLKDLKHCSPKDIETIICGLSYSYSKRSMSAVLPTLRSILDFFYDNGIVNTKLSGMVMNAHSRKGNVAAYIAAEDESKLLKQLEQESKRTRAVVLLALRLGLRDSDITNLKIQEIDWKGDKIRLTQKKTGQPLVLPLLPDVGNALMDYILHERYHRKDNYSYVFLMKKAPYNKLLSVYAICSKVIINAEISPVNGESIGVHLYRYTLVHRLLEANVPHQVITDTLGHVSKNSDKPYISMEEAFLRECALDLSVIGKKKWKEDMDNA